MAISDADLLRVAHALHAFFGPKIAGEMLAIADDLNDRGDSEAATMWLLVAEHILDLEDASRNTGRQ